jgi:dihydrofolate reductase
MRRIIASVNISLDGFVAGSDGEMDWHTNYWTAGMAEKLCQQLSLADTILLGRNTYTAMANYWPKMNRDLCYPREDLAFAGMMNEYDKVVVSKRLKKPGWNNSVVLKGNLHDRLWELKNRPGKDIIALGSITLLRYLLKNGLIEELLLWLHPVVLGDGIELFDYKKIELKLFSQYKFGSGVVLFCYEVNT